MNRTSIEWVKNPDGTQGYTWNPITGCLNGCPYCYARRLANGRLRQRYLDNHNVIPDYDALSSAFEDLEDPFYPRFWKERLAEPIEHPRYYDLPKQKGIFVCDMSDLFGIGIPEEWTEQVMYRIKLCPYHRFYLLTKQPQNLVKFSPFPSNCRVGVTVTNNKQLFNAQFLAQIKPPVIYLSIEPLLEQLSVSVIGSPSLPINWLIIGAMTGNLEDIKKMLLIYPQLTPMPYGKQWTLQPKIEWVEEIVRAADKVGIPVFLKDNLLELVNYQSPKTEFAFNKEGYYRQEMPKKGLERLKCVS